jgi:aminopeptidase
MDPRIEEHARILVEWSTEVKQGDMVVVNASPASHELVVALMKKIAEAGGRPIIQMAHQRIRLELNPSIYEHSLRILMST